MTDIYVNRGLEAALARQVAEQLMAHDALAAHARDELGFSARSLARPLQAAVTSAGSFTAGAVIPLLAAATTRQQYVIPFTVGTSLLCLLFLGALSAAAGRRQPDDQCAARGVVERPGDGCDRRRGRAGGIGGRLTMATDACAACKTALLRVAQMDEADRLTVAAGTPGVELMHNAGTAVAREAMRRWSMRPTAILCGPGNNGGDGFVVASALAAAGWPVRVGLLGSRERLRGEAQHHAARWTGDVEPLDPRVLDGAELVVDALFGSGLSRPLGDDVVAVLAAAAQRRLPILAVDVPSGLMGDTGESLGAVRADCTVTFTRKKPAHLLLPGRDLCGATVVADIGTPAGVLERIAVDTWENDPALWRPQLPQLKSSANKYTRGHALLCGGYPMTGAARMAARAAARVGAGLTTIAVPEAGLPVYAAALTSIMVRPLAQPDDLSRLLADARFSALLDRTRRRRQRRDPRAGACDARVRSSGGARRRCHQCVRGSTAGTIRRGAKRLCTDAARG